MDLGAEPPRIKICGVPPRGTDRSVKAKGQGLKETMSERIFTGFGILTKYIAGFGKLKIS